jgi:aryl-alcohol dehydrogenase-like predicted oxidoreductase
VSSKDASSKTWRGWSLGNPAVSAVIPGTGNPEHMADNLGAGRGRLPDAAQRRKMVELFQSLG